MSRDIIGPLIDQARDRQDRVLARMASGASLNEVLEEIVELIEAQLPESVASILLLDREGRIHPAAGARLPADYSAAIQGLPIGPSAGSCGTAAYRRQPVVVADIATDPLWADYRDVALRHDLRACWSFPIMASDPLAQDLPVLGTFALYRHAPAEPDPSWIAVLEASARLAGMAIERSRAMQALRESDMALRRSEGTLRRAQEIAHLASWTYDIASDEFHGEALSRMCGLVEGRPLPMTTFREMVHVEDRTRLDEAWSAARSGGYFEVELRVMVNGELRWFSAVAAADGFEGDLPAVITGVTQDVTSRRRLEERIQHSQKMEAVGLLAGGIAHDFNNLLTVIAGHTEILLSDMQTGHQLRADVMAIRDAGERATRLISQLLSFSRKAVVEPRVLDLNRVVESISEMLGRLLGEHITLSADLDPGLSPVRADAGQMEQLLMNLAVNARDAMSANGRLLIKTTNVTVREGDTRSYPDCEPGRYACLSVADTGCGMTEEVRARIFEPFFTTKGLGKGTGLGLATVFGIVRQAGGFIDVRTAPGRGTEFRVLLPAVAPIAADILPALDDVAEHRGHETILVVEDDSSVRRLARIILESRGYTVIEAGSGVEAISHVFGHAGPIHALLTDVVIPDVGGRELADRIRALRPSIAVLYMSGYADDALVRQGVSKTSDVFLRKPFTPSALAARIRDVLASGASTSS